MSQTKDYMETLSQQMRKLKEDGYKEEFSIKNNKISSNSGLEYEPEDVLITKTFRFEGESNPADSSELFAIETKDNKTGLLVLSYGAQNEDNAEVIKRIRFK